MTHTDDITVKQAVDYILRQPDGKLENMADPTLFCPSNFLIAH